jgi:hypothetical protein
VVVPAFRLNCGSFEHSKLLLRMSTKRLLLKSNIPKSPCPVLDFYNFGHDIAEAWLTDPCDVPSAVGIAPLRSRDFGFLFSGQHHKQIFTSH